MEPDTRYPPLPPVATGLAGRCPRCGRGPLFQGFLGLRGACPACGLDYSGFDPADGPAVFIILIVGFVVCGLALIVEVAAQPPYWVHAALWLPLVLALSLGLLRPLKGVMIAQQYRHRAAEGRLAD
jgi:uncharacterized protein (DUF983 family)